MRVRWVRSLGRGREGTGVFDVRGWLDGGWGGIGRCGMGVGRVLTKGYGDGVFVVFIQGAAELFVLFSTVRFFFFGGGGGGGGEKHWVRDGFCIRNVGACLWLAKENMDRRRSVHTVGRRKGNVAVGGLLGTLGDIPRRMLDDVSI